MRKGMCVAGPLLVAAVLLASASAQSPVSSLMVAKSDQTKVRAHTRAKLLLTLTIGRHWSI